jgi:hypothetical protein
MTTETSDGVWLNSSADPETGAPVCVVECTTGGKTIARIIEPETAMNTARELCAAAASAEVDIAMMKVLRSLDAPDHVIGGLLRDIRQARPMPEGKVALRIAAVAGYHTMQPYVRIGLGSLNAELTPDGARQMAQHWTEAAAAAQIDARLRYVLGGIEALNGDDIEDVFYQVRRAGGDPRERNSDGQDT